MSTRGSSRSRRFFVAAGVLLTLFLTPGRAANAAEGFYAGIAAEQSSVRVAYAKSAGIDAPPATYREAEDDARDAARSLRAFAGYRRRLAGRFYLSGEVEAALYAEGGVSGFLEKGTGGGDRDVWPGAWTFEKRRGVGFNVKAGYIPESLGFLGAGRSLYLLAGMRRLDARVEAGHDNGRGISGVRREDVAATPWLFGLGVEFGDARGRFDLRVSYARYDFDFRGGGDGSALDAPRLRYGFDASEWSVSLGYVWSFSRD